MSQALIVVLVVLWAVVLLPGAVRARRRSTMNSVHGFGKAMDVLKQRSGRRVISVKEVPHVSGADPFVADVNRPTRPRVARVNALRRRNVLVLSGVSSFSLVVALLAGGGFWALWLVSTAALGAYVAWLRNLHVQRMQADEIVAELADLRQAREQVRAGAEAPTARAVGD